MAAAILTQESRTGKFLSPSASSNGNNRSNNRSSQASRSGAQLSKSAGDSEAGCNARSSSWLKRHNKLASSPPGTSKHQQQHQNSTVSDAARKFKLLRQQLRELETWHDTMYHSPIATRLATSQPLTTKEEL